MATSPNFSWPEPDNSDLVKNGALAIRTAVDAIDSSMGDLKGGTTGQVLSKASNTDMDFTWVAQDDSNAIQNAIVDAKGDLIAATAADTPARLAVGTNGQVLTADSTSATGLAWATPSGGSAYVAGKNAVLNSNMSIWARGTSNTGGGYAADRFGVYQSSSLFVTSRQTASLTGFNYCLRNQRPNGNTSTGISYIYQDFESINSAIYAGQTVAFSFYARAGANFSASGSGLVARVISGTGTDQNSVLAGYTSQTNVINQTATLTTSWQRFTYTGTVGSSINQIGLNFLWTPTGTAGAADYVEITGVQLEIAASATAYSPNAATYQAELAACQRYYWNCASGTGKPIGMAFYYNSNQVRGSLTFPVEMRTAPSLSSTIGTNYYVAAGSNATDGFNSFTILIPSTTGTNIYNASEASGTDGKAVTLETNNSSALVAFSAEL